MFFIAAWEKGQMGRATAELAVYELSTAKRGGV
jgi:hypothetical protein